MHEQLPAGGPLLEVLHQALVHKVHEGGGPVSGLHQRRGWVAGDLIVEENQKL